MHKSIYHFFIVLSLGSSTFASNAPEPITPDSKSYRQTLIKLNPIEFAGETTAIGMGVYTACKYLIPILMDKDWRKTWDEKLSTPVCGAAGAFFSQLIAERGRLERVEKRLDDFQHEHEGKLYSIQNVTGRQLVLTQDSDRITMKPHDVDKSRLETDPKDGGTFRPIKEQLWQFRRWENK